MPPPNMPLWNIDYSEPKAPEKQRMQEGLSGLPFLLPMRKVASLYREEQDILVTSD